MNVADLRKEYEAKSQAEMERIERIMMAFLNSTPEAQEKILSIAKDITNENQREPQ